MHLYATTPRLSEWFELWTQDNEANMWPQCRNHSNLQVKWWHWCPMMSLIKMYYLNDFGIVSIHKFNIFKKELGSCIWLRWPWPLSQCSPMFDSWHCRHFSTKFSEQCSKGTKVLLRMAKYQTQKHIKTPLSGPNIRALDYSSTQTVSWPNMTWNLQWSNRNWCIQHGWAASRANILISLYR